MKLAIISPVLPPAPSGQAIVLYRLLRYTDPEDYILISPSKYDEKCGDTDICSERLSGQYFNIPHGNPRILYQMLKGSYFGLSFFLDMYLNKRTGIFVDLLKKENISKVIVCTADLLDPYCAYIACQKLNIPFYLYVFDDYIDQWTDRYYSEFAKVRGPLLFKNAAEVIVPNESLKSYYNTQYSIDPVVIHNPVDLSDYGNESSNISYDDGSEIAIVYTGSIYAAQYDALTRLTRAISNIEGKTVKLHVFSSEGLDIPETPPEIIVNHNPLPLSKIPPVQKNAHILFLPLAFHSDYPANLIRTSSPGKMGEYLASGRPIIVHAPPDSFVSWYFNTYECGIVVDSEDEDKLTIALEKIINDAEFREKIMSNARRRAVIDFDLDKIRKLFFQISEHGGQNS
jgi:glycosyltransferase involved in cell wall biosynthesis